MSSRLRAATVALLTILVFAAGALPACAAEECCAKTEDAVLHRAMPCCDESTIAARDAVDALHAAPAVPQLALPVAAIEPPSRLLVPRAPFADAIASSLHHESGPPLFLLNDQFRI